MLGWGAVEPELRNRVQSLCNYIFRKERVRTKTTLKWSPRVNFSSFVASSFWHRFSGKLVGVWDGAQQMVLESSCSHLRRYVIPTWAKLGTFSSQDTIPTIGSSTDQRRGKESGISNAAGTEGGSTAHP